MKLADVVLCAGFSLALPIGQTLFKFAAVNNARLSGPLVMRLLTNAPLIGAFAWYGLTALFWFYILTRVPLSPTPSRSWARASCPWSRGWCSRSRSIGDSPWAIC